MRGPHLAVLVMFIVTGVVCTFALTYHLGAF